MNYVRESNIQIFIEPHRISSSSSSHIGTTDIHDYVNIVTKAPKKLFFGKMEFVEGEKIEKYQISGQHSYVILSICSAFFRLEVKKWPVF